MSNTHKFVGVIPQRKILIDLALSKPDYKQLCMKVNRSYGEDIFQEVCVLLCEMPADKLPEVSYFNFWFYRVAYNMMSKRGDLGKLVLNDDVGGVFSYFHRQSDDLNDRRVDAWLNKNVLSQIPEPENEPSKEDMIKEAEEFMLSLPEFENRIILLYNKLGNMKKVQRATGISYSALRFVKNKLKRRVA